MLSDMLGKIQALKEKSARNRELIVEKQRAREAAVAESARLAWARSNLADEVIDIREKIRAMTGMAEGLHYGITRGERQREVLIKEVLRVEKANSGRLAELDKQRASYLDEMRAQASIMQQERLSFRQECALATQYMKTQRVMIAILEEEAA